MLTAWLWFVQEAARRDLTSEEAAFVSMLNEDLSKFNAFFMVRLRRILPSMVLQSLHNRVCSHVLLYVDRLRPHSHAGR